MFLQEGDHGYSSISEFVEVALLNQLGAEEAAEEKEEEPPPGAAAIRSSSPERPEPEWSRIRRELHGERVTNTVAEPGDSPSPGALLAQPKGSTPGLLSSAHPADAALFVLTNRLSPVKVAARVLANLGTEGRWPPLKEFHGHAARAARELGFRLRAEDRERGAVGHRRRWVGYPIGKDERAALDRFVFSFTILSRDGAGQGPMALLGLANVSQDQVGLTEAGLRLAQAPSPLLDQEADGITLSETEAQMLRIQLMAAPGELNAVHQFLEVVRRAAGRQVRVDELLASRYADWTADLTVAHRSAMLGRLADVAVLEVSGRGATATITLLPAADEFRLQDAREEGA